MRNYKIKRVIRLCAECLTPHSYHPRTIKEWDEKRKIIRAVLAKQQADKEDP